MAHFAKINKDNIVEQVIVIDNEDCLDNGVESEAVGAAFCSSIIEGDWKQTSYNGNMRKHYAGVGFTYDVERDAFIPPKPFASWVLLDEETCLWKAPVPMPAAEEGFIWEWDEASSAWMKSINTTQSM